MHRPRDTEAVRRLDQEDEAGVLSLNATAIPHVARLDMPELRRLRATSSSHIVLESGGAPIGYALVFADSDAYDGEEFQLFKTDSPEPFTYIDQVVVKETVRGSGAGRRLYAEVEQMARTRAHHFLCCEVNVAPPNPGSLAFHLKLGFGIVKELATRDGRRVNLLKKSLRVRPHR